MCCWLVDAFGLHRLASITRDGWANAALEKSLPASLAPKVLEPLTMSERTLERRQLQKSDVKHGPRNKKGNGPFLVHLASQGNRCARRLNWVTISFPGCELAV